MDRFLYIAMSGATETLRAQTVNNHNLANAATTGFRADLAAFQTRAVAGPGYASRAYGTNSTTGWSQELGPVQVTGRELDIAVQGQGWIAVQANDGGEAYTRAGDLRVDSDGVLKTGAGHIVMGGNGPLTVPPYSSIAIGGDGSISIVPLGQASTTTAVVGRIKLVNPPASAVMRAEDGLFRVTGGAAPEADAAVRVTSGALEGSNVNAAEAMVTMIELARHFEMQVKAMRTAEQNAASSAQLLKMG